jgi:hypothetical protein
MSMGETHGATGKAVNCGLNYMGGQCVSLAKFGLTTPGWGHSQVNDT